MKTGAESVPAGLFPGLLDRAGFDELAAGYRRDTGFALAAIEADGQWLWSGDGCACVQREACRPFRAQAVAEALRWGEPCVQSCACGRALWAVPVMRNQRLHGGLLVAGGAPVSRQFAEEIGADGCAPDAVSAVDAALRLVA